MRMKLPMATSSRMVLLHIWFVFMMMMCDVIRDRIISKDICLFLLYTLIVICGEQWNVQFINTAHKFCLN
jgi:hypothetical protein